MKDRPHDPFGGDVLLTHTPSELEALRNARLYGAAEERARIVAFIRDIPGVEELPTVWTFCQDLAARIERDP